MIHVCPRCRRRFVYDSLTCSDVVHECNSGNDALDQEDIQVIGNWSDYTGSGAVQPGHLMSAGNDNLLQFSDAFIVGGEDLEKLSPRGKRLSTNRQRQHLEFIELNKKFIS